MQKMTNENVFSMNDEEYLTFLISDTAFAVNIKYIVQVIQYVKPSKIPKSIDILSGVIPFRGEVIPVINFYGKSNFVANDYTIILVLNVNNKKTGLIVDSIHEISYVPEEKIEKKSIPKEIKDLKYINGIFKLNEIGVIIIDVSKIEDLKDLLPLSKFIYGS
jgi:purine-binding chemotaxis protein CheW